MRAYHGRALVFLGVLVCFVGLVGCDREPSAWNAAKSQNTVEAYESYLREHAAGPHAAEAKQVMVERREDREWETAKSTGTTDGVDKYVLAYPQGRFTADAMKLRDTLVETHDWAKAKAANTIESLESFLLQHPQSQHNAEAKQMLTPLRTSSDWENAAKENSIESWQRFIRTYGDDSRVPEAKASLSSLERQQAWAKAKQLDSAPAYSEFVRLYPDTLEAREAKDQVIRLAKAQKQREHFADFQANLLKYLGYDDGPTTISKLMDVDLRNKQRGPAGFVADFVADSITLRFNGVGDPQVITIFGVAGKLTVTLPKGATVEFQDGSSYRYDGTGWTER
jgi:outer membrane protein assembly factor BamD (BamD/ComL family)